MSNNTEETYSEPCQTSTMESSQKAPALSVWQGSEYAFGVLWQVLIGLWIHFYP